MRAASLIESIFKLQESIFIKISCLSRIPNLSVNLSIIYTIMKVTFPLINLRTYLVIIVILSFKLDILRKKCSILKAIKL